MSKRTKKHRSKASQKRHAATKRSKAAKLRQKKERKLLKKYPQLNNTRVFSPETIEQAPTILEMAHSYDASNLGGEDGLGVIALSLAQYVASLRQRLFDGDTKKQNAFIQFGYSHLGPAEFTVKPTFHANGGFNMSLMQIALLNNEQGMEFVFSVEQAIKDIIAQLNERNEDIIRSVHLTVDETDEEVDPSTAFGFEGGAAAMDYRVEGEVNVAL